MRTRAKLGEMTMRVELQAELLEKRGYGDELRKLLRAWPGESGDEPAVPADDGVRDVEGRGSSVYALRARLGGPLESDRRQPGKRGRDALHAHDELLQEIRTVLKASPFLGEGHRKVKARLASKGIRVGKNRVLADAEHGLLAPVRRGILAETGATAAGSGPRGRTNSGEPTRRGSGRERRGWCWFFAAVDHSASDVVGWHVAKKGDRWAALEPIRQGVRAHMGGFGKAIALGLGLRHDWGSQYRARQFQAEIKWLGIRSTPAYVGEPECNGIAERFIRTLKEECIYLHDFETLEEARAVIGAFIERYNNGWLLQRHGYLTPARAARSSAEGRPDV